MVKAVGILVVIAASALAGPDRALAAPADPPPVAAQAAPPAPAPASAAQQEAAARAAYKRGADLYAQGRWREAIVAFEEADRLKPSPRLQFNVGQAYEKLGDLPAALAAFARYLRADPGAANRDAVEKQVRSLESRLARLGLQMLHVTTTPPGAEVAVDEGAPAPAPVDAAFAPGRRVLRATLAGWSPTRLEVDLPADHSLTVNLALDPAPRLAAEPPASPLEATRPVGAPVPPERSWLGPIVAGAWRWLRRPSGSPSGSRRAAPRTSSRPAPPIAPRPTPSRTRPGATRRRPTSSTAWPGPRP
jgi:hypothetical protein